MGTTHPPCKSSPGARTFARVEREILERLDVLSEYQALGVRSVGTNPNPNGWISAFAIDRDEQNPSAAICVAGGNGSLGRYVDKGGSGQSLSFWDFAAKYGPYEDWRAAREAYAAKAGVTIGSSDAARTSKFDLSDHADILSNAAVREVNLGRFAKAKGLAIEAIRAAEPILLRWSTKMRPEQQLTCFAFEVSRDLRSTCGAILYRVDGRDFPAAGNLGARKTHCLRGSQDGWLAVGKGPAGEPLRGMDAIRAASTVWRAEGIPDALALSPYIPVGHAVATNIFGANETANCPFSVFKGKAFICVGDADDAGQSGAEKAARAAAKCASEVRLIALPYPITPSNGKDLRDFFAEGHTFDELQKLAKEAPAVAADRPAGGGTTKGAAAQLDPMVVARDFLKAHGTHEPTGELTLRYWRDEFYAWNGRRYMTLPEPDLRASLVRFVDGCANKITRAIVTNVIDCLKAETLLNWHLDRPRWLGDAPPSRNYVAMRNGLLDLDAAIAGDSNCLLPHSPLWFSPVFLPYDYNPTADCPTWRSVIYHNLEHDQQRIDLAQEWSGYLVANDTALQKFMIVVGEGANGKSVWLALITAMLGEENVSNVPLEMFGQRCPLNATLGKLANIAAEVGELDKVAEGYVKAFTAGDRMQFERKFKDPIEATPSARLMLATNTLPRFADRSGGIWRRLLLIPFNVTIAKEERIHGLDKPSWWADSGELPGVLNWALDGLRRLHAQGQFTESKVCAEALEEHRTECNPARQFLLDHFTEEKDPLAAGNAKVITSEVYQSYRKWCEASGYHPLGERLFGKEIIRTFRSAKRARIQDGFSNRRVWCYVGVRERTTQDDGSNALTDEM